MPPNYESQEMKCKLAFCSSCHLIKWKLAKVREVRVSHPWDRAKIRSHVLQNFFIIHRWNKVIVSGFCKLVISQTLVKSNLNPRSLFYCVDSDIFAADKVLRPKGVYQELKMMLIPRLSISISLLSNVPASGGCKHDFCRLEMFFCIHLAVSTLKFPDVPALDGPPTFMNEDSHLSWQALCVFL